MVVGEETDIHRQARTTHHNKNIMAMTEVVEEVECRPVQVVEEDRCRDHQQQIQLEEDTMQEEAGKVEDTPQTVVLLEEEDAPRR
jgi:hypothetical protein